MDKNELKGELYLALSQAHEHLSPAELAHVIYEAWGNDATAVQSQLALRILEINPTTDHIN